MYTAFRHPAANRAIELAARDCRQILERFPLRPQFAVIGDAAYETLRCIEDLEDSGYLDQTEARIARQIAHTAMHGSDWRPLCLRKDREGYAEVVWEAELVAAAKRIKPLVARQASFLDRDEMEGIPQLDPRTNKRLLQVFADDESEEPLLHRGAPNAEAAVKEAQRLATVYPACFVFAGAQLVHNPRLARQELTSA